ncbi:hypothetical protein AN957_15885 [Cytobacillus solani]|uniref:Uncharacterized protein n=1 Tax=Cytobacillus solani TaxID=1637975 RepID=A0A0Q3VIE8_9BACI|nr:hypothetical protein AN957_15885 [Cytobacillus solani]
MRINVQNATDEGFPFIQVTNMPITQIYMIVQAVTEAAHTQTGRNTNKKVPEQQKILFCCPGTFVFKQ